MFAQNLELISIHVPKTAGSAFREYLEKAYPQQGAVQSIYTKGDGVEEIWQDGLPEIGENVRVLHGHFPATPALRAAFPKARVIAWIREPVTRIISYYFYWKRLPRQGNRGHDYFLDNDLSLVEFARHPTVRHEMLDYFARLPLSDFFFIGLVERFEEDVRLLATEMGWPVYSVPRVNASENTPYVSPHERHEIERAMADQIDLYQSVKALRGLA